MHQEQEIPRRPRVSVVEIPRLVSGWYHGGGFPFNGWRATEPGIRLDDRRLPWTGRLIRDYCHAFERLAPYFAGSPSHAASWIDALESRRRRRPDGAIADLVLRQLENRGAPAAARTAAARLRDADTVAVVTGQQAGLFGGPLFTLHKAITALRLARRLADEHGAAAVPVFWVDAEDHDLEEIRGCHVLDGEQQRVSVSLDIDAPPDTSAAAVVLDDAIRGVLDSLRAALPPTEFTAEVLDALAASYAPGTRLVDAFARWLDRLLGDHGLVVFDASDPAAKPFVRSLFKREIGNPGRTAQLAADAGAGLTALGYHAQASPAAGAVALFRLDGARQAIRAIDGTFSSGGRTLAAQALLEDIDNDPARFSPNVLLRPVVQDTLLPTVAYVAGPSELAYLGQLRGIYAAFDVPMPIIYPRASATLVDAATVRFLNRYEVDFAPAPAARRRGAEPAAGAADSGGDRTGDRGGRAIRGRASRHYSERRPDARSDSRRSSLVDGRPHRQGARKPARQGRVGREAEGFDPAAAVRASAGAELSRRRTPGTERRRRPFPEPARLHARRPAAGPPPARPRPSLAAHGVTVRGQGRRAVYWAAPR